VVVVEIGERHAQLLRIGAGQAGAAEHDAYVVVEDILGDATPQQLHGGAAAIGRIDAGTAELQDLALVGEQRLDVVFVAGVELAAPRRAFAPHHPIGADHAGGARAALLVEDEKMVAILVEGIEVAANRRHLRRRAGGHRLVEHAIAQSLGGAHFGGIFGETDAQIAADDIDGAI
jgi:hypothetical protein